MTRESNLTRMPQNTSLLQSTKYTFSFPNLPFLNYFVTNVNIPGISTNEVTVSTPFSDTYRHGDKLVYEPLMVNILLDEDLRVWEETHNWLTSLTFPRRFEEYAPNQSKQQFKDKYYDSILTINTNSNIANMRLKFRNCHPTSLSGLQFSTNDSELENITSSITFRYDYYDIERL